MLAATWTLRPDGHTLNSFNSYHEYLIEELDGTGSSVASDASEDSDDSDFDVGEEDKIDDVEVDMADFRKHTDGNVVLI
nr:hypothetical protein [Tanacetum cinerariifolium]